MRREELAAWIEAYERLWRTEGTDGLGDAFAEDVVYSMAPYEQPVHGLGALREVWERERLSADEEFEMVAEIVAVEGDTGVARTHVQYGPPRHLEYKEIWVVTFDADGRCSSFEEWPFWPGQDPLPEVERPEQAP